MKKKFVILCFTIWYATLVADASAPLSLQNAIELLKHNSASLKIARYEQQIALQQSDKVSSSRYGSLDFIQNFSRSNDALNVFGFTLTSRQAAFSNFGLGEFNPQNPNILDVKPQDLNNPGDQNFVQSKLVYQIALYSGGKISAYSSIQEKVAHIKALDVETVTNASIFALKKSYYDMALLHDTRKNLLQIQHNLTRLQESTATMIQEGYAKKIDLLEVKAKLSTINTMLRALDANELLLYQYISYLLNTSVNEIILPKPLAPPPYVDPQLVYNTNLSIAKAETAQQIASNMEDLAFSNYLPLVGFNAEAQTSGKNFANYALDRSSYTIGLQLKWNLFHGGADHAANEEASLQKLKADASLQLAKQGVLLHYNQIRTNIKADTLSLASLDDEITLYKDILENYEGRYKEQLVSINDILIKQSTLIEKIVQRLQLQNRRNQRILELETITKGTL